MLLIHLAQKIDDASSSDIDDSDLASMLTDASQKVTTQKLLLVAHSQGNFYANAFYDTVLDASGGVPGQSLGVYSVATPADRVAGGGLYLTSDTDNVISKLPNILKPNIHINFNANDDSGMGHDFSKIYLAYQGDRIVSDIKTTLSKLQNNNIQDENSPCLNPPKLTIAQNLQGLALQIVDPISIPVQTAVVNTAVGLYQTGNNIANAYLAFINGTGAMLANAFGSLAGGNSADVITATDQTNNLPQTTNPPATPEVLSQGQTTTEATPPLEENSSPMTVQLADAVTPVPILPYPSGEVPSSPLGGTVSTQDKIGTGTPNPYADLLPGGGGRASTTLSAHPSLIKEGMGAVHPNSNNSQSDSSQNSGGNQNNNNDSSDGDNGKLNCTPPKILNATGDACIDPAIQDTTPPVITLVGASTITLNVGDSYSDAGATALDDVDGDITAKIVTVNLVDTSKVADYTITYNVSDAAGNPAVQVSRLVHVIAPAPSLTTTTISQDTILAAGEYTYDNLIITNNAHLYLVGDPTSPNSFKGVKINAVNITIDPGAHVSADAQGYGNNQGPGASSDPYEGASYGGLSYNTTVLNAYSKTYGSALKPFDLGSGGNSAGGGAIYFNVSDTFTDNGIVSADGNFFQ